MSAADFTVRYVINPDVMRTPQGLKLHRRFDALALEQLREIVSRQAEQIEQLQAELAKSQDRQHWAEQGAEMHQDIGFCERGARYDMEQQLRGAGLKLSRHLAIGMTKEGNVGLVEVPA